jgi:hypothetical protein
MLAKPPSRRGFYHFSIPDVIDLAEWRPFLEGECFRDFSLKTAPPPTHKTCKFGDSTIHVAGAQRLTSNSSLQTARFLLQTRLPCKVAPPSRHALALRAHRHRLSAVARKKNVRSRAGKCRVEREVCCPKEEKPTAEFDDGLPQKSCRGDWIRTSDLLNPIQAR